MRNVACRLKLLERLKVHPTFHVSFLKEFHEDENEPGRSKMAKTSLIIRKQFEEDVNGILDHIVLRQSKNIRTKFLILWKGNLESEAI